MPPIHRRTVPLASKARLETARDRMLMQQAGLGALRMPRMRQRASHHPVMMDPNQYLAQLRREQLSQRQATRGLGIFGDTTPPPVAVTTTDPNVSTTGIPPLQWPSVIIGTLGGMMVGGFLFYRPRH